MKLCSQCNCEATYVDKRRRLCDMHYRINQMRQDSWTRYKVKHSIQELVNLIPENLACPKCNVAMVWRRAKNQKGLNNQLTIQHWRDGSIGFLCMSCNVRHSSMYGDSYKEMDVDQKKCPKCNTIKPKDQFCFKSSRSVLKRNSICNLCNQIAAKKWKDENKEKVNAFQRAYRLARKLAGNPILRKK